MKLSASRGAVESHLDLGTGVGDCGGSFCRELGLLHLANTTAHLHERYPWL